MSNFIVGLTGGIGSGKSTAARHFAALGVPVVDADLVARELVAPGSPALREIHARFGDEILRADGGLDRARLRELVFADPDRRRALEAILHPRVYAEMARRIAALDAPYCIAVIPLLLETGRRAFVDRVLVVDSSEALQRARARRRDGVTATVVNAVMRAQVDRPTRRASADDIIDNDGDLAALQRQVEVLHHRYLALAAADGRPRPLHDPRH